MREYRIQCEYLSECPQASSPSDQLIRQTRQHPPPTTYKAHVRWPATEPPTTHSLRLLPDRIRWNWPQKLICRDGCASVPGEPSPSELISVGSLPNHSALR